MNRNFATLSIGLLLALVFGSLLFCFQVRINEIALVTTFGKPTRALNTDPDKPEPGLYFKWPWPIEKVLIFDKRIQNFESRYTETLTRDRYPVMVMVYAGWTISDPAVFRERFGGSVTRAETDLEGFIGSAKNTVIGQYNFADFLSTDEQTMRFEEIERAILAAVQPQARANYGIDIRFLGIKRLGLPESVTQKVFDRMREERQRVVAKLQADGEARARDIRSAADRERAELLAQAEARATEIRGQADAEAAQHLAVFRENPEFALFLLKLQALEQALQERATLILDQRTPPFDLLDARPTAPAPAAKP